MTSRLKFNLMKKVGEQIPGRYYKITKNMNCINVGIYYGDNNDLSENIRKLISKTSINPV